MQNLTDLNQVPRRLNIIKVMGEGEIAVQPDTASINFGVITDRNELIAAQRENSANTTKVIDSLLALGIDKNQLKTFDYRIEPIYDFDEGKQIFRGYKITHILQVKITDLSLIGNIVDTTVQNGANYVANIEFTTRFKDAYYQQALTAALNNASEKARTIGKTLRVTLIPTPIHIIEGGSSEHPFQNQQVMFAKGQKVTQIQPGQLYIKAQILAEYKYNS